MGKVKATYFSILAWRIQARIYSPWGCKESGTAERLSLSNLIKLRVPVMRKDEFIQRNECLLLLTKCLIIFFIILYILAVGFSLLGRLFSSCREQGPFFGVVHGLLLALASLLQSTGSRLTGFSSCSTGAQ